MILDEIAEKARVRVAESKKRISPDVMAEKAKQKQKRQSRFALKKHWQRMAFLLSAK